MAREGAASTNIFWGYGSDDPLIKPYFGQESVKFLQDTIGIPYAKNVGDQGLKCEVYEGVGHSTNLQELQDLETFIKRSLPNIA